MSSYCIPAPLLGTAEKLKVSEILDLTLTIQRAMKHVLLASKPFCLGSVPQTQHLAKNQRGRDSETRRCTDRTSGEGVEGDRLQSGGRTDWLGSDCQFCPSVRLGQERMETSTGSTCSKKDILATALTGTLGDQRCPGFLEVKDSGPSACRDSPCQHPSVAGRLWVSPELAF